MALFFVRETTLNKNQWMKADTETKDPDRFNPQQNKGDNRNIQYEKRNGKVFTRSYRMNLPRIVESISSTNWDELPWPNVDWEGIKDYDKKSLEYCLEE